MSKAADIDSPDPVDYLYSTVDVDVVLKDLGFRLEGTSVLGKDHHDWWLKPAGRGIWHSVIVDKNSPEVSYRKVKVSGRGKEQVIQQATVPVSQVRRFLKRWHTEAQEVIQTLLDNDPDAFDPRADLDRLIPHRCPECGSTNISSEADDEGLLDCFNCGIWFDPLHPDNSPVRNQDRGEARMESTDPDDPIDFINRMPLLNPRIQISYSQTTPESAEQGDTSDSGWIDDKGAEMTPDEWDREEGLTAVDLAAKFLKDEGATQASASYFYPGVWYSSDWGTVDYATGTTEERNYHLVDFSPEEEHAIWNKVHERQRQN